MNTREINRRLKNVSGFLGTFPCDRIPPTDKYSYSVIINTDNHTLPGSHWTALLVRGKSVYFFDSFGRNFNNKSFPPDFINYVSKLCRNKIIKFNDRVLQSFQSNTCGYYCVYFIKNHMNKREAFSSFTDNLNLNDRRILKIVD